MASKRETEHEQNKEQAQAPENPEATTEGAEQQAGEPRTESGAELDEARARHLRLAADFENYKKRVRQEKYKPVAKQKQINGTPHTQPLRIDTISEKFICQDFLTTKISKKCSKLKIQSSKFLSLPHDYSK
jgi:chromatin segregation and condensation protein Rec8/ScpA/Scc1 (kleisin family)